MIEIIAEIAQGFEGKSTQARLLMKAAAAAKADAVKYQLVYADELATPDYKHYELFKKLEMVDEEWEVLGRESKQLGIRLYLDVFGSRSLKLAERLSLSAVKLHGTDIANVGFLEQVASSSIPRIFLGAGGAYLSEIKNAIEILANKQADVLLGFQGYPTQTEQNLISRVGVLVSYLKSYGSRVRLGFADHVETGGPLSYALAAIAIGAGAEVIEKHLTLGRTMKLEDHESALNPDEFAEFCTVIRDCGQALGKSNVVEDFGMTEGELEYRKQIRRHVVTSRNIPAGTRLSTLDLVLKRTSTNGAITDLNAAYGRVLNRKARMNSPISQDDLE